ncbi:MAG: Hsp70 family protein [Acidobacteria bacterium]|nr:Hsp70 family protein [Acidobacteriota bacterium]
MASTPQFVIGIDLGTTNCALAYASIADEAPEVRSFPVHQLAAAGDGRELPLLPSALFLHGPGDFPEGSTALAWEATPRFITGQLAKIRGAEIPDRVVLSAKSWLCHSGVDRLSAILPLTAPESVTKISPVEASRHYLTHLRQAWDHAHPEAPFRDQQVLVTVPASFDAVARELTIRAANEAGYGNAVLLEEPQAAFYAWLERHPGWRDMVRAGDLILVADTGGGTTDFSLIAVTEQNGSLELERVAVGEHILLGGDNMDLALTHSVEQELAAAGHKIDAFQFNALWQNCRNAKEKMLGAERGPAEVAVTIPGRGSKLIGGSIKAKLRRDVAEQIVIEGFFPSVESTDLPAPTRRAAFSEIGLPYAAEPAITRHLAKFLRMPAAGAGHATARRGPSGLAAPTHILFNGGVFHAGPVRERILSVLNHWLAKDGFTKIIRLDGEDLMHAVSRGAAYYGLARRGRGVRMRAGCSRTYYIGVQPSALAVPGLKPKLKALTVAPFGMEEGTRLAPVGREFGLLVGEQAGFRFFSSVSRKEDAHGEMIEEVDATMEELAPIEVTLPAEGTESGVVPVKIETEITETGQLQLWCTARDSRRWKLEFNVRGR